MTEQKANLKLGQSPQKMLHKYCQDTICLAFSKWMVSPLSLANGLKAQSPNLMRMELKRELPMQYSAIPYDIHATQAFA